VSLLRGPAARIKEPFPGLDYPWMYLHPAAGGVRLEKARRGGRIGTVIPPENASDQRDTTVLNAIL